MTQCLSLITMVYLSSSFDEFLGTKSVNNLWLIRLISYLPPAKIFEGFYPWVPQTKPIFVERFGLLWLSQCYCVCSRLSLARAIVHIVNALKYLYLAFLSFWMNDVHTTCSSSTCLSISQLWFNRGALWTGCWELYRYFGKYYTSPKYNGIELLWHVAGETLFWASALLWGG